MTVIAAMVHEERVYMAGDSGGTDENGLRWRNMRKINWLEWTGGRALVATSGASGLWALFATRQIKVHDGPDGDPDGWAQDLADTVTEVCAASQPPILKNEGQEINGELLVAAKGGHLWAMEAHCSLRVEDYAAIGSGAHLALGAMTVLAPMVSRGVISPHEAVVKAVEAAIEWCATCHGDIHTGWV